MIGQKSGITNGDVKVTSTSGRGLNPTELADMTVDKIISIADTAHPVIKQQAMEYRNQIWNLLVRAFTRAQTSERTTLYNLLTSQGHEDMAEIIKRL